MRHTRFEEFVHLFNEGKFFEAHETLECLWRELGAGGGASGEREVRRFYQGLIQLAAALVHLEGDNLAGAYRVFESACCYLRPFEPHYEGIDLIRLKEETHEAILKKTSFPKISSLSKPYREQKDSQLKKT